jgi:DNA-binding GntR family transcriptional regulator
LGEQHVKTSRRLTVSPTLSDQAYRALREMITSGDLSSGQRVTERSLAAQLGVSATPVREALRRLEHERLMERPDGRILQVADPSPRHLYEMNLIEGALRGTAARLATENATESELAAIEQTFQQTLAAVRGPKSTRAERGLACTSRFHDLIDQAAHNETLLDMIATATAFHTNARRRAVQRLGDQYPVDAAEHQHQAIVDSLLARDGNRAEQLMREHISEAGEFRQIYGQAT